MIDTTVMTQNAKKTNTKTQKTQMHFFYNIAKKPEKEIFAF